MAGRHWIRGLALGLGLALGGAGQAAEQGVFDISVAGVRAATLSFAGRIEAGQYAASGQLRTTGLLRLVSQVAYAAEVRGFYRRNRFQPTLYRETAQDGDDSFAAEMRYIRGVPQPKGYAPPRNRPAEALDPATQAGTVDIMTTIYAVLRDAPRADLCTAAHQLFDGARRSQVTLANPQPRADGRIDCAGEYRRLQGFSAQAMADQQRFPFTLTYRPLGDGRYRVVEVVTQSTFGRARLTRRGE